MKKSDTGSLAKGTITLDAQPSPIVIPYQEHSDRNGQLLAELNRLNLCSAQLLDLSQQLKDAEEKLAKGRAWYARMASTDVFMTEAFGHLADQSEDNR